MHQLSARHVPTLVGQSAGDFDGNCYPKSWRNVQLCTSSSAPVLESGWVQNDLGPRHATDIDYLHDRSK